MATIDATKRAPVRFAPLKVGGLILLALIGVRWAQMPSSPNVQSASTAAEASRATEADEARHMAEVAAGHDDEMIRLNQGAAERHLVGLLDRPGTATTKEVDAIKTNLDGKIVYAFCGRLRYVGLTSGSPTETLFVASAGITVVPHLNMAFEDFEQVYMNVCGHGEHIRKNIPFLMSQPEVAHRDPRTLQQQRDDAEHEAKEASEEREAQKAPKLQDSANETSTDDV